MTSTPCATPGEKSDLDGRKSSCSSVRHPVQLIFARLLSALRKASTSTACDLPLHFSAGYQCEVDALLCVNRQSSFSRDQEHFNKATELLKQLLDHTCLFPPETGHQSRYLYVMVHGYCTHTHTHTHLYLAQYINAESCC